jgi:hypothetical protein
MPEMKPNLDTLKTDIEHYLEESGMAIFYVYSRALESMQGIYWDCDEYPDYRQFVKAAQTAGVKMVVFHQRAFSAEQVDDALEQLVGCDMPREEYHELERRLNDMRVYESFICAIELSFDYQGRVFLFDLRTEWYEELSEILDEIQIMDAESDSDEDTPMSGYFSKN